MGPSANEESKRLTGNTSKVFGVAVGTVVDNNDPYQMGRLRVIVPSWGGSEESEFENKSWAEYVSPLGGSSAAGSRGINHDNTAVSDGQVGYGFWAIPKVGATVLVACIDNNPNHKVWLGCIYGQFFTHTLPHGRYNYKPPEGAEGEPAGPLTSSGTPIEPLHSNLTRAFTSSNSKVPGAPKNAPRKNFEFRSRGADHAAAAVPNTTAGSNICPLVEAPDDRDVKFKEPDGNEIISNQGYKGSRIEPDLKFPGTTEINYDSQVYSLTTPGFHSLALDDSIRNCRIKIRTTCGHQIILDDTNERIYISTCEGKSWIEIDQKGNIDIFAERNVSVRAQKDINFTADGTFRVHAKGIHLYGTDEIRLHSPKNIHMQSDKSFFIEALEKMNMLSTGEMKITTKDKMNLKSGADMLLTGGPDIHLNGPAASPAEQAKEAFWTNRLPEHEPWARTMMDKTSEQDKTNKHKPEFTYNDKDVGRKERGQSLGRNARWHR